MTPTPKLEASSIVSMPNISVPREFEKPETWTTWKKRFDRYITVANLSDKSDKEKIDLFLYTMGEKGEPFKQVSEEFTKHFAPKRNVVFERFKFNSRYQQEGESVDSFITALYTLA